MAGQGFVINDMKTKTDVLVIGAGPAGCVAAATLHQAGLLVQVVERENFPRFVIGESLLPRCMEALEDAGFMPVLKAKLFQEKFGAKFIKGEATADFNFTEQFTDGWSWTWQVPRAEFDLTLAQEVQRMGVAVNFETTVTNISIQDNERSVITVTGKDGTSETIEARFIVDASGYGRVIPKMFNLEMPSTLDPRKAVFAHVQDVHRDRYEEPNRILILVYAPGVWVWVIPFSSGITSVGFVGDFNFFGTVAGGSPQQFKTLINGNEYLHARFGDAPLVFEPRKLEAWSATSKSFYGKGFVLTGNVTEFLDPIFSSGVMFAIVSGHQAAKLVIKKTEGQVVDWETEYTKVIQQGVDTFKNYVTAWYDGTLEKIFFAQDPDPEIIKQICSVLAGYVWDTTNPFVRNPGAALNKLAKLIDARSRTAHT
jgi:flavin-dependent dehydrogenase